MIVHIKTSHLHTWTHYLEYLDINFAPHIVLVLYAVTMTKLLLL